VAIIRPFNALRPSPPQAKDVSSVPYDVVNTEEARALANGNAALLQSYLDQMSGRTFRRAIFAKQAARDEPSTSAFAALHAFTRHTFGGAAAGVEALIHDSVPSTVAHARPIARAGIHRNASSP